MGADIHYKVERRILTPKRIDTVMRSLERAGDVAAYEAAHAVHWEVLPVATFKYVAESGIQYTSWRDNFIQHDPDIWPWLGDRNYGLFGVLAGVRDCGGDHMDGHFRGLPEDASIAGVGQHSMTWYMCHEIIDADLQDRMPLEYSMTQDITDLIIMCMDLINKYGKKNVRLLLGFDS